MKTLERLAFQVSQPPIRTMAKLTRMSVGSVVHHIKNTFGLPIRRKPKVHVLTAADIAKRCLRSWPMYLRLRKSRWQRWVTTDEAMFYINNCNGQRRVQYVSRSDRCPSLECYQRRESNSPSVMVWAGVSFAGKTGLHFVQEGAKINSVYYIEHVLKPFLRKDARRLYQDGCY